jgi:hypothetical protein
MPLRVGLRSSELFEVRLSESGRPRPPLPPRPSVRPRPTVVRGARGLPASSSDSGDRRPRRASGRPLPPDPRASGRPPERPAGAPVRDGPERVAGAPDRGAPGRPVPVRGGPDRAAPERGAPVRGVPDRDEGAPERDEAAPERPSEREAPERLSEPDLGAGRPRPVLLERGAGPPLADDPLDDDPPLPAPRRSGRPRPAELLDPPRPELPPLDRLPDELPRAAEPPELDRVGLPLFLPSSRRALRGESATFSSCR